jgi:hypothetical protein
MDLQFVEVLDPPGYRNDVDLLQEFEQGLDTRWPEKNPIPCKVLGYGEISTVLRIGRPEFAGLAFKRISVFRTHEELAGYVVTYLAYNRILERDIGLNLPNHGYYAVTSPNRRPILYLIQNQLPNGAICNQAMDRLEDWEDESLLVIYANNDKSVVQILPPLIIEAEDTKIVLERLDRMLNRVPELVG